MVRLDEARRALASQPGLGLTLFESGYRTDDGTYVGVATGADARRTIVSSDLVRQAVSGSADTESRSDYHDAQWVYWPEIGEQRSLANQGYQSAVAASSVTDLGGNSDVVAVIKAVRNFSELIPPASLLELHAACPVEDMDQMAGLHTWLRRAARAMRFRSRLPLVGTGTRRADLSAFPWIDDEGLLIAVYDQETISGTDPLPLRGGGELRLDGQGAYLLTDAIVQSGQPFYADFWRPRSSWVAVDGVWADSAVGPIAEDDEIAVNLDQWVTVAYYFVCDALSQNNPRGEVSSWGKRRDRAAHRAAPFMQWQTPPVVQRSARRSTRLPRGVYARGGFTRSWP